MELHELALDLTAACVPNSQDRRRKWRSSQREYFLKAPRTPWWYNDSVAGPDSSMRAQLSRKKTEVAVESARVLLEGAAYSVVVQRLSGWLLKLINFFIRGLDMPYPPNYQVGVDDTPDYREPEEEITPEAVVEAGTSGTKVTMIVSVFINVILVLGVLAAVVYSLRWKHR
ncbi:Carboxypeptidase, partial [Operophtera brumata]